MKKLVVTMFVIVTSIVMLAGCTANEGNVENAEESEAVSSETNEAGMEEESETVQTNMAEDRESISETESEVVENVVMYSADEVMAHIDTLIEQFPYNNPEHIKALVIAANMDYITEEELNTLLNTYAYSIDELAVVYDECILDNAAALQKSFEYSQGQVDILVEEDTYDNRITLEVVMLNDYDKENAKWYDDMLTNRSRGTDGNDYFIEFSRNIENVDSTTCSVERTIYTYAAGVYANKIIYTDYLENSYVYYIETSGN